MSRYLNLLGMAHSVVCQGNICEVLHRLFIPETDILVFREWIRREQDAEIDDMTTKINCILRLIENCRVVVVNDHDSSIRIHGVSMLRARKTGIISVRDNVYFGLKLKNWHAKLIFLLTKNIIVFNIHKVTAFFVTLTVVIFYCITTHFVV